jgi:hypothetical protein
MGLTGGIDNAVHIAGLSSGFIVGLILHSMIKKNIKSNERTASLLNGSTWSKILALA